jgi:hypothetical protein
VYRRDILRINTIINIFCMNHWNHWKHNYTENQFIKFYASDWKEINKKHIDCKFTKDRVNIGIRCCIVVKLNCIDKRHSKVCVNNKIVFIYQLTCSTPSKKLNVICAKRFFYLFVWIDNSGQFVSFFKNNKFYAVYKWFFHSIFFSCD